MARAKKSAIVEEPIVTMDREVLPNGNIYLYSEYGLIDTRNNQWHSEVVCKPQHERFFVEAPHEEAE